VPNTPGTIDSDYRGELKVILINHGPEPFTLTRGDRIAQLVLAPVTLAGLSPWILKDFRSPRRQLGGVQDGWNRKGLISEMGEEKLAFAVLAAWYAAHAD
jgi:hypothetical protein